MEGENQYETKNKNYKSGILMNKHKIIPVSIFPMFSTIDLHVI